MEKAVKYGEHLGTAAMQLSFARLDVDGKHLVLLDGHGTELLLPVTPRLRAALGGEAPRIGQVEIKMDSTLRPRDIQARIRAGETAEAVAEAGRTTVEKILPFVAPVLAEREHLAERAQKANVRRPAGDTAGGTRTLGDAVAAHLRAANLDPSITTWDAWRREDGRWTVSATFAATLRSGTAHFTFDQRGNYVVVDNDDARWLVGEMVASPAPGRDDLQSVRERRMTALTEDELPLGDDAIDLVRDPEPEPLIAEPVVEELVIEELVIEEPVTQTPPPEPEPPARRPAAKKKGRASVPSWDEIMFGSGEDS